MIFSFVDESGKPQPGYIGTFPTITSVCIDFRHIKDLTKKIYQAEIDTFGEDDEIRKLKGNHMVHRNALEKYPNRKDYTNRIVSLIETYDMKIFSIIMEKPDFEPYKERKFLSIQDQYLLQRVGLYGERQRDDVLVIYDKIDESPEGHGYDGQLAEAFKRYLKFSPTGKQYDYIIQMPLFVNSRTHNLIRFPDLVGNIIRVYHEGDLTRKTPKTPYEEWIADMYHIIQRQTMNFTNCPGMYVMSKDKFSANEADLAKKRRPKNKTGHR
ncbi:MAG: DUF3800 domain-containing protein [Chitinophagales bacterium]